MSVTDTPAAGVRGRVWFGQSCDSFKRTFPHIAKEVPWDRFYVCPVCLHAFPEDALALRYLTREHVPPESVGGKRMVLTCGGCNWSAGQGADSHARREAHLYDFASGNLKQIKAGIRTRSGRIPIVLSAEGRGLQMFGVPRAAHPDAHAAVMADFEAATHWNNWRDLKFTVEFPAFSPERARASWLRSAYLAFFAALGYRFVFRPELDIVRARIKNPESAEPRTFRVIRAESAEPTLIRIDGPSEFRSYAMFYGRNVVFLPRYGDRELYARLVEHPETTVSMSGIQYPWPSKGPTFFHDRPSPGDDRVCVGRMLMS
jgi:hypothetical protein